MAKQLTEYKVNEKLMIAAYILFSTKGFENTSLEEVIREAGINEEEFKKHFPGKAELFLDIINFRVSLQQQHLIKLLDTDKTAQEIISDLFISMIHMTRDDNYVPVYLEFIACRNDVVKAGLVDLYVNWRDFIQQLLKTLKDKGKINPQIDEAKAAAQVIALYDGFNLQYVLSPQITDLDYTIDLLKRFLI